VHERRTSHAAAIRAELKPALAEARALAASRFDYAREQAEALTSLQGRNQKLVDTLARQASQERARIEQARALLMGLRTVHHRHADELARLLDPNEARNAGIRARRAVLESTFSSGIGEALDGYFAQARERLRAAVVLIEESRASMSNVSQAFARDFRIAAPAPDEFTTERFGLEIDRLEERCTRDFKGTASLVLHRRKTLGARFFDTVALKVIHVFEIADREVRAWMNGFVRPLESQVTAFQEQANNRIEGMGRIQDADGDLVERLEDLRRLMAEGAAQREQLEAYQRRLQALLEVQSERSLA
jgi:ABC-type transporter Mla subunit MlaD